MAKKEYTTMSAMGTSYNLVDYTEVDKQGQDYILYGSDNLFPQKTINLYQNSATHNALVNSISSWIYGNGLDAENKEQYAEEWAKFQSLITKTIGKNDVQLMCMDLKLHGGFYISFTYSMDRESIAELNVIPFETMRSGKPNEEGDIEHFYYSTNWEKGRLAKVTTIKSFSPQNKEIYPTQVLFVKMNSAGSYFYPKPDYIGAWNYIELDKNVSQFHLSQIENGLAPSYIFNFKNGVPPKEKRDEIKRDLESELTGSQNAGKFLCTFSNSDSSAPEIIPIQLTDAHNQYQFLSEEITKKVMISHRVISPRLFGVMDGGGLGNNADELKTASELFEQVSISGFRDLIIDALQLILLEDKAGLKLKFKSFDLFTEAEEIGVDAVESVDIVSDEPVVEDVETEQVDASYNGAQISSAIDIIAKVQEGVLSQAQAVVFLIQFLQLPEEIARGFFTDGIEQVLSKITENKVLDFEKKLASYGAINDDEEWQLYSDEWADTSIENFHQVALNKLPTGSMADADARSKYGDVGMFKVRYYYKHTAGKTAEDSSREFCKIMMQLSNRGVEWRFEDIYKMSSEGVNGALASKGNSKYDLFLYKGGANCYHGWMRRIYMRKRDAKGRILPNDGMKNEKRVGNNPYVKQKGKEAIAPITTPNKGFVNPR